MARQSRPYLPALLLLATVRHPNDPRARRDLIRRFRDGALIGRILVTPDPTTGPTIRDVLRLTRREAERMTITCERIDLAVELRRLVAWSRQPAANEIDRIFRNAVGPHARWALRLIRRGRWSEAHVPAHIATRAYANGQRASLMAPAAHSEAARAALRRGIRARQDKALGQRAQFLALARTIAGTVPRPEITSKTHLAKLVKAKVILSLAPGDRAPSVSTIRHALPALKDLL